ncbi:c-type cytochrome biogenesis protein CcmI [uncultured Halopseudomonas sp.]|uniref:c-type cytochrome biogenesis protein CcmI n=1 Tax=uncultured Halopseudomonas sp. TaxID=2901193 RepID=UPI0030EE254C|tara:strand:+ start:9440 stop:10636 length:1197 start_codon:yes stop_codon:yes gene_type:complete
MIDFWLASSVLVVLGMLSVLWPLWRRRQHASVDRTALNVALYEERIRELDAQVVAGEISSEQRDATLEEASRLLLSDTDQPERRQRRRGAPWVLVGSAAVLPAVVIALYFAWGNPDGLALAREMEQGGQPESVEQMISRMERITQVQPESGEAWYMLGRAYLSDQRPAEAAQAFGESLERLGDRPEVLAQLGQARFFASGNQLDSAAVAALDKALELDPNEPTALGLLGIAAFESGDYPGAIRFWERLLVGMPPQGAGAQAIQGGIARARERMGEPVEQVQEPVGNAVIRVRLELADGLADEVGPDAIVFIFAREAQGPPMPLVARRLQISQLPADIVLSSSDAMLPDVKLTEGQTLQLNARLSPTGDVMQGSHEGHIDQVTVGDAEQVILVIDQAVQ